MTASMLPSPLLRPGGRNCCSFAILMISATSSPRTSSTLTPLSPSTRAGACLAPRARPPRPPPPPRGPLRVLPGGDAGGELHHAAARAPRPRSPREPGGDAGGDGDGELHHAAARAPRRAAPRRGAGRRGHSGGWRNAGRVRFRNTTFRKSLAQTISFCETLWLAKRIVVVSGAKRCGSGV